MQEPVIAVRELAKRYLVGSEDPRRTQQGLVDWLLRPYRRWQGIPEPKRPESGKTFWALKGVSFDVYHGEKVGIIGRNGAGKSTLLKILSRLVYPTEGEVRIRGRVTSLLEVGTGFNQNLSGRDNIYLNASLHGLERREIDQVFDDIVDFSGIGSFLDTPVKRYSSGMYMRLAFAVAAHLDPDILMLDEVLAVGDMAFQQKCLKRVEGLTSEGRTILFVSHSMDAVTRFCDRCIWLEHGKILRDGSPADVIAAYMQAVMGVKSSQQWGGERLQKPATPTAASAPVPTGQTAQKPAPPEPTAPKCLDAMPGNEYVRLVAARAVDSDRKTVTTVPINRPVGVEVVYDILKPGKNIQPSLHFRTAKDVLAFVVAYTDPHYIRIPPEVGRYAATAWVPADFLNSGLMYVTIVIATPETTPLERHITVENAISFNIHEPDDATATARGLYGRDFPGVVRPLLNWETLRVEASPPSPLASDHPQYQSSRSQ